MEIEKVITTAKKNKVLHLVLKAKWFEMIKSGVKTEEYRDIKPYWEKRLLDYDAIIKDYKNLMFRKYILGMGIDACRDYPAGYTHVLFHRGYSNITLLKEIDNISFGRGKEEHGAPKDRDVFIIKLK